jgi:hypothetical protein
MEPRPFAILIVNKRKDRIMSFGSELLDVPIQALLKIRLEEVGVSVTGLGPTGRLLYNLIDHENLAYRMLKTTYLIANPNLIEPLTSSTSFHALIKLTA